MATRVEMFINATLSGNISLLRQMLDEGHDINARGRSGSAVEVAIGERERGRPVLEFLIKAGVDEPPEMESGNNLFHYCGYSADLTRVLLERGFDPARRNKFWRNAVYTAAEMHCPAAVRLMIEAGADPIGVRSPPAPPGFVGQDPLHIAASVADMEMMQMLIGFGAEVKRTDHAGKNVLHLVVEADPKTVPPARITDLIRLLAGMGVDVNGVHAGGNSVLHQALGYENRETVIALLECGADPGVRNAQGRTAEEAANRDMRALFHAHRARSALHGLAGVSEPRPPA